MGDLPPLRVLARGPEGATLYVASAAGPSSFAPSKLHRVPCTGAVPSKDGKLIALWNGDTVSVFDADSQALVLELGKGGPAVQAVAFSPRANYLQVFHKSSGEDKDKNLKLYALPSGAVVFQLAQKLFNRDRWPTLQWSDDESCLMRTVTNEVQFYAPADFASGQARRLRLPGVNSASLAPGPAPSVAVFVPEAKGAPGSVRIFAIPSAASCPLGEAVEPGPPLARRGFFRVSHVKYKWNAQGAALLLLATADVDATNQSYYGESSLHFLRADGSVEGAVPLPKDGPVHDVAWSPRGSEFVATYGFMPARTTLFSDKLTVLHEVCLGAALNHARWSPHGRFLVLGGFGNLPGDVALYDRKADGKVKVMAETRLANTVDNGWRVLKYTGETVFALPAAPSQLYAAEWLPAPAETYPDRPQTPGAAAAAKAAPSVVAQAKAPAYRPPGAAGRAEPVGGGPTFSLAKEVAPFFKKSAPGATRAAPSGPPGAEFVEPSKTANANAKKRAAAKAKKEAEAAAAALGGASIK